MYNNIFDTHSHYDDEWFDEDRHSLLEGLKDKGVVNLVSCGCDIKSTMDNMALANEYDYIYFAAGFHPENLEGFSLDDLDFIAEAVQNKKCVAIGEIGLDYHWMSSPKDVQIEFFEKQIELAKDMNLPIIVHDREAHGDTMDILRQTKPKGVVHCFSGSKEMAREIIYALIRLSPSMPKAIGIPNRLSLVLEMLCVITPRRLGSLHSFHVIRPETRKISGMVISRNNGKRKLSIMEKSHVYILFPTTQGSPT